MINVGASLAGCRATLELMEKYPFVYGAMGVHPGETEELSETGIAWLREQCSRDKVVAVGEYGRRPGQWERLAWIITGRSRKRRCRRDGLSDSWNWRGKLRCR